MFTVQTRRLIILGIILLCCVGALVGKYEVITMTIPGFFALIKDDKDDSETKNNKDDSETK